MTTIIIGIIPTTGGTVVRTGGAALMAGMDSPTVGMALTAGDGEDITSLWLSLVNPILCGVRRGTSSIARIVAFDKVCKRFIERNGSRVRDNVC